MHTVLTYEGLVQYVSKFPHLPTSVVFLLIAFGDESFKFLTFQLSMVVSWVPWQGRVTQNGGSILDRVPKKRVPLLRKPAGAQITPS